MVKKAEQAEAVMVELPIDRSVVDVGWSLHVDTQLTPEQSNSLRKLASALDKHQATTRNGQRVTNPAGAVRWMLEQVAEQIA